MTGIEILHSSEVLVSEGYNAMAAVGMFVLIVLVGLILGATSAAIEGMSELIAVGIVMGVVIGLFGGVLTGAICGEPEQYETHYEVLISDEVSMNEFLEQYEIIEQKGKIYTVKERTSE